MEFQDPLPTDYKVPYKIISLIETKNEYCTIPNTSTRRFSKVMFDHSMVLMVREVRFLAFQSWFWIENWPIIKESMVIFVSFGRSWHPQTMRGASIRVGASIRDNAVSKIRVWTLKR